MILAYDCSRQKNPIKYIKLKDVKDEEEALYEIGRFLEVNKLNEHYSCLSVNREEYHVNFKYGMMQMFDVFEDEFWRLAPSLDDFERDKGLTPLYFTLVTNVLMFENQHDGEYQWHPFTSTRRDEMFEKMNRRYYGFQIYYNRKNLCDEFPWRPRKNEQLPQRQLLDEADKTRREDASSHYTYTDYPLRGTNVLFRKKPIPFIRPKELRCGRIMFVVWWYDEIVLYYKDVFKREVGDIKCH